MQTNEALKAPMLNDVPDVEAKLFEMLDAGRGRDAIRMMLGLLVDLRDCNAAAQLRIHGLLRRIYGRNSEKITSAQLDLFFATLAENSDGDAEGPVLVPPVLPPAPDPKRSKHGGGRKPLPDDLPVETVNIPVPDDKRACPKCGAERQSCEHEVTRLIEYVPPSFKILEEKREKLICRPCGEFVTAPLGVRVVEGARPGPQLVATLIVNKWQDATPHNRSTDIFARLGVNFSRSTLTDWAARGLDAIEPIAWRITQRVLGASYINIDDTGVRVLDKEHPNGVKRGHMWSMIDRENKLAAYFYTKDWSVSGPAEVLTTFSGYLQSDEYAGFEKIAAAAQGRITRVGCHMHARRRWEAALDGGDARAAFGIDVYKRLYAIERACKDDALDVAARHARRRAESVPLLDSLREWADRLHPTLLPTAPLRKATMYLRDHWDALTCFLSDGRLDIDNGIVERELRRVALGRKNWLFAGSDDGAARAAVAYTILATCRINGVEPTAYIVDVLKHLSSGWPMHRIDELLPDKWAPASDAAG